MSGSTLPDMEFPFHDGEGNDAADVAALPSPADSSRYRDNTSAVLVSATTAEEPPGFHVGWHSPAAPTTRPSTDAVTTLRRENERLKALLVAAQPVPGLSIARLQRLQVAAVAGGSTTVDARDLKIMDLARQVRALTSASHKLKGAVAAAAAERASRGNGAAEGSSGAAGGPQPSAKPRVAFGVHLPPSDAGLLQGQAGALPALSLAGASFSVAMDGDDHSTTAGSRAGAANQLNAALRKALRERDRLALELRVTRRALAAEVGGGVPLQRILASYGFAGGTGSGSSTAGCDSINRDDDRHEDAFICDITASCGGGSGVATCAMGRMEEHDSEPRVHEAPSVAARGGHTASASSVLGNSPPQVVKAGDWRGRTQTIGLLQARIRALERSAAAALSGVAPTTASPNQDAQRQWLAGQPVAKATSAADASRLASGRGQLGSVLSERQHRSGDLAGRPQQLERTGDAADVAEQSPERQTGQLHQQSFYYLTEAPAAELAVTAERAGGARAQGELDYGGEYSPLHGKLSTQHTTPNDDDGAYFGGGEIDNQSEIEGPAPSQCLQDAAAAAMQRGEGHSAVWPVRPTQPRVLASAATSTAYAPSGPRAEQAIAAAHDRRQRRDTEAEAGQVALRAALEEARRRGAALKSRAQVIESELSRLRSQVKMLAEKSDTDDSLIEALQAQGQGSEARHAAAATALEASEHALDSAKARLISLQATAGTQARLIESLKAELTDATVRAQRASAAAATAVASAQGAAQQWGSGFAAEEAELRTTSASLGFGTGLGSPAGDGGGHGDVGWGTCQAQANGMLQQQQQQLAHEGDNSAEGALQLDPAYRGSMSADSSMPALFAGGSDGATAPKGPPTLPVSLAGQQLMGPRPRQPNQRTSSSSQLVPPRAVSIACAQPRTQPRSLAQGDRLSTPTHPVPTARTARGLREKDSIAAAATAAAAIGKRR